MPPQSKTPAADPVPEADERARRWLSRLLGDGERVAGDGPTEKKRPPVTTTGH
jgi:hypothetical protein